MTTETTRAVSLTPPARDVDPMTWQMIKEQAKLLYMSSLINKEQVKSAHDCLLIVLKGRELGVPPTLALQNIVVVKGKATANAELMLALIYRDHGDDAVWFEHSDDDRCTISYTRRSWPARKEHTFSMDDARRAGLLSNQTWSKYPANMLRARCISAVARMAFPDTIGGMYSYEELGVPVNVSPDGAVVADGQVVDAPIVDEPAALPDPVRDVAVLEVGDDAAALRQDVTERLAADREAASKLPKGTDDMTRDELDKTLTWLRNRAKRSAAQGGEQADAVRAYERDIAVAAHPNEVMAIRAKIEAAMERGELTERQADALYGTVQERQQAISAASRKPQPNESALAGLR